MLSLMLIRQASRYLAGRCADYLNSLVDRWVLSSEVMFGLTHRCGSKSWLVIGMVRGFVRALES